MQRQSVDSSNLASIGYDAGSQTLEVEFRDSGAVYRYNRVPAFEHKNLIEADSIGRYFNINIKSKYSYQQV